MIFRLVLVLLVWRMHSVESCPECKGSTPEYDNAWDTYKSDYDKVYENCFDECNRRITWEKRCKYFDEFNKKALEDGCSYKISLNKFADWTDEEIAYSLHGADVPSDLPSEKSASWSPQIFPLTPPTYFNYADVGYVTSVKNQGNCGNCWAFSAAGAIEGQLFKSCGELIDVSVQQINDCCNDDKYTAHGCRGGWMNGAFRCSSDIGGLVESNYYSLKRSDQDCSVPAKRYTRYLCNGYVNVAPLNESSLMQHLLTVGPISCAIDAPLSLVLYESGVYSDLQGPIKVNHAVLITGCGTTSDGINYWIAKNSWGRSWGERGYFRLLRDRNLRDIARYCSYPINCRAV